MVEPLKDPLKDRKINIKLPPAKKLDIKDLYNDEVLDHVKILNHL